MLSFLFSLCIAQIPGNQRTNITYTNNENAKDMGVIQMITSGTGTMFDYKVAFNRNDPVATACRYTNGTQTIDLKDIESCVCSSEQKQPENTGDYYIWSCDKSFKNEFGQFPKDQAGTLQKGHTCETPEKSVCVGFDNTIFGHYGLCMSSENGALGDDLIFAYAQRNYVDDVKVDSNPGDTCFQSGEIEENSMQLTVEQIKGLSVSNDTTGALSMMKFYLVQTPNILDPETIVELIGYRFQGDEKFPFTVTFDKGFPSPNITLIGEKGCTDNTYFPEASVPVDEYCKSKTDSDTLTEDYIESIKLFFGFMRLFCFTTSREDFRINENFTLGTSLTDNCTGIIDDLFENAAQENGRTSTRSNMIQAYSVFVERIKGPTYGPQRMENDRNEYYISPPSPELIVECGVDDSRFCFLSSEYILTKTYKFTVEMFNNGAKFGSFYIINSSSSFTFEGIFGNRLKYCVPNAKTYDYFNFHLQNLNPILCDSHRQCISNTLKCSDPNLLAVPGNGSGSCCCVEYSSIVNVSQCTLVLDTSHNFTTNIHTNPPGLNFNDLKINASNTYSDYLFHQGMGTINAVVGSHKNIRFYTQAPPHWDVKIEYPNNTLYIDTTPLISHNRIGNYLIFDQPIDIRKNAILYGWNDTSQKIKIEYLYINSTLVFIQPIDHNKIFNNITFDEFKMGGVYEEGLPMRGKFYNSRKNSGINDALSFSQAQHFLPSNGSYTNYNRNLYGSLEDFYHLDTFDTFQTSAYVDFRADAKTMFGFLNELSAFNDKNLSFDGTINDQLYSLLNTSKPYMTNTSIPQNMSFLERYELCNTDTDCLSGICTKFPNSNIGMCNPLNGPENKNPPMLKELLVGDTPCSDSDFCTGDFILTDLLRNRGEAYNDD